MAKIFYDHLIKIEEVTVELDNYELTLEEREEFISLIDETLHNHTLNVILSHLPQQHHENFLSMFHKEPHKPELLDFLKKETLVDIEEKIRGEAEIVKKEILAEIKKAKRKF